MKTLILKLDPRKPDPEKIKLAAKAIRNGKLVIFPTETVYGLGANALNSRACRKIFNVKKRHPENPLIVHISDLKMAEEIGNIPDKYKGVIKSIWPGPITIVVKARKRLPQIVTAKLDTVALRMPSNRIALSLIKNSAVPIAAPSVNISSRPSATSAEHAIKCFNGKVDIIIDAGKTKSGIESTIIDLGNFELLRPGAFTLEDVKKAFGRKPSVSKSARGTTDSKVARSPGMKYMHYSPATPLFLYTGTHSKLNGMLEPYKRQAALIGSKEMCIEISNAKYKIILGAKANLKETAKNLFDSLIKLDSLEVRFAIVQSYKKRGLGLAIMNRLRKATQNRSFSNKLQLRRLVSRIDAK